MATTVQLTSLKINVMSEDQYVKAKANGDIQANELYLVKSNDTES